MDKTEIKHIAERFVIHFFCSAGVMLAALVFVQYGARHWAGLPSGSVAQVIVAALGVFAFATVREAYDVKHGQSLTKAIWDYCSWGLGCALSAWGFVRLIGG